MNTHQHHGHEHTHEHHRRSSKRNAILAAVQIPVGIATGSLVSLVAGMHNLVDSKVHGLRHDAACESEDTKKKAKRLQGAALLAGTAIGAFFVEKMIGIKPESTVLVTGIFAAETFVNAVGVHDDLHQVRDTDTRASLSHNIIDTAVSGATAIVTGLPVAVTTFKPETFDAIAGYSHLTLIGGIALKSAYDAYKN